MQSNKNRKFTLCGCFFRQITPEDLIGITSSNRGHGPPTILEDLKEIKQIQNEITLKVNEYQLGMNDLNREVLAKICLVEEKMDVKFIIGQPSRTSYNSISNQKPDKDLQWTTASARSRFSTNNSMALAVLQEQEQTPPPPSNHQKYSITIPPSISKFVHLNVPTRERASSNQSSRKSVSKSSENILKRSSRMSLSKAANYFNDLRRKQSLANIFGRIDQHNQNRQNASEGNSNFSSRTGTMRDHSNVYLNQNNINPEQLHVQQHIKLPSTKIQVLTSKSTNYYSRLLKIEASNRCQKSSKNYQKHSLKKLRELDSFLNTQINTFKISSRNSVKSGLCSIHAVPEYSQSLKNATIRIKYGILEITYGKQKAVVQRKKTSWQNIRKSVSLSVFNKNQPSHQDQHQVQNTSKISQEKTSLSSSTENSFLPIPLFKIIQVSSLKSTDFKNSLIFMIVYEPEGYVANDALHFLTFCSSDDVEINSDSQRSNCKRRHGILGHDRISSKYKEDNQDTCNNEQETQKTKNFKNFWAYLYKLQYLNQESLIPQQSQIVLQTFNHLYKLFVKYDKSSNGILEMDELKEMLKTVDIEDKMQVELQYRADRELLNVDKFIKIMGQSSIRYDVNEIYVKISKQFSLHAEDPLLTPTIMNPYKIRMTLSDFKNFLLTVQKEKPENVDTILRDIRHDPIDNTISPRQFLLFLMSEKYNNCINPQIYNYRKRDLTMPYLNYYISSSHNTYLQGNQVTSYSSVNMYKEVLLQGCRSVELDVYDYDNENHDINSDSNLYITHGGTLTSKISFKEVIECIYENAFKSSDMPVCISLQNKIKNLNAMSKMAAILVEVLGEKLITKYIKDDKSYVPSPLDMRYKFYIKDKVFGNYYDYNSLKSSVRGSATSMGVLDISEVNNSQRSVSLTPSVERLPIPVRQETSPEQINYLTTELSVPRSHMIKRSKSSSSRRKRKENFTRISKIRHEDIEKLIIYTKAVSFKSFKDSQLDNLHCPHNCSSLSETKVKYLAKYEKEFIDLTNRQVIRVYPKATTAARLFQSDNYDPVLPFALGCQMVALNWQTNDTSMLIYRTFFRQNGGCGFVKKPKSIILDQQQEQTEQTSAGSGQPRYTQTLKLTIISASKLHALYNNRWDNVDPYICADLYDYDKNNPEVDGCNEKRQTKAIKNNGWNPCWSFLQNMNNEFVFENVCLETAFIVLKAKNEDWGKDDDDIGRVVIPLNAVRFGYRIANLENKAGKRTDGAQLLLKIEAY